MSKCIILDGKETAKKFNEILKKDIKDLLTENPNTRMPKHTIYHDGTDPASQVYMKNKIKACNEVGINCEVVKVENRYIKLNEFTDGAILQLPVEDKRLKEIFLTKVDPIRDVDGLTIENKGHLFNGTELDTSALSDSPRYHLPCTPLGIMRLLKDYCINVSGKNVVIVNRSELVVKPLAMLMMENDATVTICHSKTKNLKELMKSADIVVTAVGKANYFDYTYFKENAILIDVSINRDENGKLCGDVNTDNLDYTLSYRTPVPGGVGPLTVSSLLHNTFIAWRYRNLGF